MNVLKIVVDELPERCFECGFYEFSEYCKGDINYCNAIADDKTNNVDMFYLTGRPSWCPLVIEERCEWKEHWEYTSKIDNEGFWHIDTKCDWEYPEDYDINISELVLDNVGQFVKSMGFTYCPNCSKRIEYKEE